MLTEGGYPYPGGDSVAWCDRLVRGLAGQEFEVYALGRDERQRDGAWPTPPANVVGVRTVPLWGPPPAVGSRRRGRYGRRERRLFDGCFTELVRAVCAAPDGGPWGAAAEADRFADGLHGLAELAREHGGLADALRSERALRLLEDACRAPGALHAARAAGVIDLLTVADRLERVLRPLSPDWYGEDGLAAADVCHAVGGGPAALPGLLAGRRYGTPLLVTEYGVRLREHYLTSAASAAGAAGASAAAGLPVRALLASFHRRLAHEAYRRAALVTSGNAHARRWQLGCGAERNRLRTVHPGMDASELTEIDEDTGQRRTDPLLLWVGRVEPARDLVGLLHAVAELRRAVPGARLLVAERPDASGAAGGRSPKAAEYLAHCRALAAQLFPDEAADLLGVGDNPVRFVRIGEPEAPRLADAYAAADVVVLSSVVEGFPVSLVEAMFAGRATVATDVGAVHEAVGGTGLVVPPRNPRALANACAALLGDPARRARLGAAARARAVELFTVEQNLTAFRGIYLELLSRRSRAAGTFHGTRPFALPPEAHLFGHREGPASAPPGRRPVRTPSWARAAATAAVGEGAR
nr:DUF3492 domain-containing protein [Streptomyces taklimakanensis]